MARGRPPKYSDPALMEAKVDQYFDKMQDEGRPPTLAGVSFFLGFEDRKTFSEYARKPEFAPTIKKAKLRIEMDRSERLLVGPNTAGVIFDLTNNHGWQNPQHVKHSGPDGGPIRTLRSDVSAEEAAELYAASLRDHSED